MSQTLVQFHSLWRYAVLAMLLMVIAKSIMGWFGNREFKAADNKLSLFTNIALHIQLLAGLVLYFTSPKVQFGPMKQVMADPNRFWAVEHSSMMLLAIIAITLGRRVALKAADSERMHKRMALYYLAGLVIIFMAIPWPWSRISIPFLPF